MGMLFWKNANKPIPIRSRTLIGRHAQCDVRVDVAKVSGHHARLQWIDHGWEVRDLASTNGTFVNGQRLEAGQRMSIERGVEIVLGHKSATFEFVDASPPGVVAVHTDTGVACFAERGILPLPNDKRPLATIFIGSDGSWMVEQADAPRSLTNGEILDVDGAKYCVELPSLEEETLRSNPGTAPLECIALRLAVSPDEEQVQVTVLVAGQEKRLPSRRFHYLLVTLARAWLAEEGVPSSMRGWIDREKLCRGLAMDEGKLSVEVFRARKQLATLGIQGAVGLIERRAGTHELRIGVHDVQVSIL